MSFAGFTLHCCKEKKVLAKEISLLLSIFISVKAEVQADGGEQEEWWILGRIVLII